MSTGINHKEINAKRVERGLTYEDLGNLIGIPKSSACRLCLGKQSATPIVLLSISRNLEIPLSVLLQEPVSCN